MQFFVYTQSVFQLGHANHKVWHMQISVDHNVAPIYKPLRPCWTKNRWMKLEERINIIRVRNQVQPFIRTGVWTVQYYSLISLGKTCINSLPFSPVPPTPHFSSCYLISYLLLSVAWPPNDELMTWHPSLVPPPGPRSCCFILVYHTLLKKLDA